MKDFIKLMLNLPRNTAQLINAVYVITAMLNANNWFQSILFELEVIRAANDDMAIANLRIGNATPASVHDKCIREKQLRKLLVKLNCSIQEILNDHPTQQNEIVKSLPPYFFLKK